MSKASRENAGGTGPADSCLSRVGWRTAGHAEKSDGLVVCADPRSLHGKHIGLPGWGVVNLGGDRAELLGNLYRLHGDARVDARCRACKSAGQ